MGLRLLGTKYLEVTLIGVDRACPCPNAADGPLVIMGEVRDGVACWMRGQLRARRQRDASRRSLVLERKACELLQPLPGLACPANHSPGSRHAHPPPTLPPLPHTPPLCLNQKFWTSQPVGAGGLASACARGSALR